MKWLEFFKRQFGDRWVALLPSLVEARAYFALSLDPAVGVGRAGLPGCWIPNEAAEHTAYFLDGASVFAVACLGLEAGDHFADLCAAPGGKTIAAVLSLAARGETLGRSLSNELSPKRRLRLEQAVLQHLPHGTGTSVAFSAFSAADCRKLSLYGSFGKVLIDAPCSSDRHLLGNVRDISLWSPQVPKKNARRQLEILTSALRSPGVIPGARIIYSTCALADVENDLVVDRLVANEAAGSVSVIHLPDETLLKTLNAEEVMNPPLALASDDQTEDVPPPSSDDSLVVIRTAWTEHLGRRSRIDFQATRTRHGLLFLPDLPALVSFEDDIEVRTPPQKLAFGPLYVSCLKKSVSR